VPVAIINFSTLHNLNAFRRTLRGDNQIHNPLAPSGLPGPVGRTVRNVNPKRRGITCGRSANPTIWHRITKTERRPLV
jgi:hypothetical protein